MQKLAEERAEGKKQHGIQKVNSETGFLRLGFYLLLAGWENSRSTIRSLFQILEQKKAPAVKQEPFSTRPSNQK
ncbi:hypothetical protein QUA71_21030 [Microcoleus sp. MON1_C5]|uniref:hypothetical protein n=1 Tax=Microcoleus sp. MON1_C5 TaxID=2818828 RepID=UPI002FD3FFDA